MNLTTTTRIKKASADPSLAEVLFSKAPSNNQTLQTLQSLQSLPSDDVLVARSRAGDTAAFEQLLGRHEHKLFRLVMRFVRNECDAQEVLQEVFLCTWRSLPGFEGRAQVGSWLHRVTVNAALMFLRARGRRPAMVSAGSGMVELSGLADGEGRETFLNCACRPDDQLESAELRRRIQKAVDGLPPGLRAVFTIREIEGYSTQQAADSLGLSPPAVKTRLHRARAALRENMESYLDS